MTGVRAAATHNAERQWLKDVHASGLKPIGAITVATAFVVSGTKGRANSTPPSYETIGDRLGLNRRSVSEYVKTARDAGWLHVEGKTSPGKPQRISAAFPVGHRVSPAHLDPVTPTPGMYPSEEEHVQSHWRLTGTSTSHPINQLSKEPLTAPKRGSGSVAVGNIADATSPDQAEVLPYAAIEREEPEATSAPTGALTPGTEQTTGDQGRLDQVTQAREPALYPHDERYDRPDRCRHGGRAWNAAHEVGLCTATDGCEPYWLDGPPTCDHGRLGVGDRADYGGLWMVCPARVAGCRGVMVDVPPSMQRSA